jgi:phospholipid/cholesterol/gamma-HCH transport system substrate-binding protein
MRDEVKAGLVILGSLLVLGLLVLGVSGISLWERHDTYTVRLRSSGGLDERAAVRLGGLRIGSVLGMRIPPEDTSQVEITLGVGRGTAIPQGTWATVATLGLLGDAFLQLTTERHTEQRLPPGSRIPSREPATIADLLQRLQGVAGRAEGVLGEIGTLFTRDLGPLLARAQGLTIAAESAIVRLGGFISPANQERVEHILADLDRTVTETAGTLRGTLEQVAVTVQRADGTVALVHDLVDENRADVRESVRRVREDLGQVGGVLTRLEGVLSSAETTLASVRRLLERADAAVGDNRDRLDETMANLERSSQNLKELTKQLKERPWSVLIPEPGTPKPGLESPTAKETRR